jgi:hypothetical protein
MHTANLVVPAADRATTLSRVPTKAPAILNQTRRQRLLQLLAGPANTRSIPRPRRTGRHDRSTDPAAQAVHP